MLYEFTHNHEVVYGTKLAVNSAGAFVMEIKGTGVIVAVSPGSVKEVLPYTFEVIFKEDGKKYSYLGTEGRVKVGNILVSDNLNLAHVIRVDTKSKEATKEFKGMILKGEPL